MIKLKKYLIENKVSKTLADLEKEGLFVEINNQIGDINIFLNRKKRNMVQEIAHISMIKRNKHGNCNNSFEIISAGFKDQKFKNQGWGQFLYSLALEYASLNDSPLMADRESISSDALRVWTALNYHKQSGLGTPLQIDQLDDIKTEKQYRLTPDYEEDDCGESYGRFNKPKQFPRLQDDPIAYLSNPLTKSYRAMSTLNLLELEEAGYLIYTNTD